MSVDVCWLSLQGEKRYRKIRWREPQLTAGLNVLWNQITIPVLMQHGPQIKTSGAVPELMYLLLLAWVGTNPDIFLPYSVAQYHFVGLNCRSSDKLFVSQVLVMNCCCQLGQGSFCKLLPAGNPLAPFLLRNEKKEDRILGDGMVHIQIHTNL